MPSHTIPNEAATKYHVSSESTTWFARLHFAKTRVGGSDDVQVLSSESGSKPKEAPRTGEPDPQRRVESPTINMTLPFQDAAQDYDVTIRSKSTQLTRSVASEHQVLPAACIEHAIHPFHGIYACCPCGESRD